VLVRPFRINEAWWAAGGAIALVLSGALAPRDALGALDRGTDVYLFLVGMMALAEFAREEGVFAWIATHAVGAARGSRARLLLLVYGAGIMTTAFLSNDATIVVLTPAVLVALKRTDAPPEPYVVACALVANAASFILPIANPSNLLFFADGMPPLATWLGSFALASLGRIAAPLVVDDGVAPPPRAAANAMLILAALALVATAARSGPLGATSAAFGGAATLLAATRDVRAPLAMVRGVAWPVVVLTAGLFVLVEALDVAGAGTLPRALFAWAGHAAEPPAKLGIAAASALASNVVNNLPVGLDLGKYVGSAHPPAHLSAAALVGVNVGPNFTVNGSLATVLWLAILRRNGIAMHPLRFAAIGLATTPAALAVAALLAR
jgi:arsenical pump membrane protein